MFNTHSKVCSTVPLGPPNPAILDCRQYYPGSMRTRVSVVHPLAPLAKLPVFSLSLAVRVCPVPPQRTSIDRRRYSFTRKSPYRLYGEMGKGTSNPSLEIFAQSVVGVLVSISSTPSKRRAVGLRISRPLNCPGNCRISLLRSSKC